MKIPKNGLPKDEIIRILKSYKDKDLDWQSGKVLGLIYDAGKEVHELAQAAYTMYLTENALDPMSFPSLLRLENEVVRMTASMLDCSRETVGNFTSGGTESLILAVKSARDYCREVKPWIREPEMVLPITAHSSLFKACHYLGIKPVVTAVEDHSFRADVDAMRAAINDKTILLIGSAPGYTHGIVDPIPDIAALAKEYDLWCHVDACVGGIHLSYMRRLGYAVPEFNLNVPGVTSLSVDLHKYGYAPKGASIVLYKNKELRKYQIWGCSRWTGYPVLNPAITSAKSGGPMAAAWAVLNYIGDEGYLSIVREVTAATQLMIDGVNRIKGLQVLGKPDMCMFALTSTTDKINVYQLAEEMKKKGWYLQPQFARENSPPNLHISLNRATVGRVKGFLKDFEDTVDGIKLREVDPQIRDLQEGVKKIALRYDDETFVKLAEIAGVTGNAPPESMAKINMLLEVLPSEITEYVMIEYLNNLMDTGEL